ncbi:Uncharacterized protein OBRU01_20484, partial [Operophtera brumata]
MSVRHVKIYYGPCDSFSTVVHKPQKLRGLVELAPVEFVNFCMLEMCGHEVFRCNIQNLRFNTSYELDPVCQRAIHVVVESSKKFMRAVNYLWLWNLIEEQILTRNKHGPSDYWPGKLELRRFANCMDCKTCC